ncbi:type II toxin-antitoxin system HicA family toxin [Chroococcidiopsis sp. CCMEE 29]|uniref:type II toxin-antitoxin system HicA family toxin n=1 Tax=Chroococcidiopsis sp. CCMEE 29 TaxID=155894 RepID=UPI002021EF1B|nr:type II toxin-antitoxin system HicA family toxin [Chroococcidiopsis sp. CCMEE 29]
MPLGPIKRRDLIACLRQLGFDGPFSGKKHQFMSKGVLRVRIPNPHQGDISKGLLATVLIEAGISREEWESI